VGTIQGDDLSENPSALMSRPIFKALTGFCLLALLLVAVVVALTLSQPVPPLPPLPNPNGYDDFVAAGKAITNRTNDYTQMTTNELRAFVQENAGALKQARLGLTRECRVPLSYAPTNVVYLEDLGDLKRLALALAAEGRLAESENRMDDAVDSYLTTIRMGQETCRGGLIINSLVGTAVEAIGVTRIERTLTNLNAKQCRELAVALETADYRREPTAAILAQERDWSRRVFGIKGQIARLVTFRSRRQMEMRATAKAAAQQLRTQTLIVNLASRAYELENGKPAPPVAGLVPEYLQRVPNAFAAGTNASRPP
jgi:hypothetical protein